MEFYRNLDEPITALTNEIERIALEKEKTVIRGAIRELFEDVIEEIFDSNFLENKGRKFSKWGKRTWKKLKKVFS